MGTTACEHAGAETGGDMELTAEEGADFLSGALIVPLGLSVTVFVFAMIGARARTPALRRFFQAVAAGAGVTSALCVIGIVYFGFAGRH